MGKSELYARINHYNQEICYYNEQIRKTERETEELIALRNKIQTYDTAFFDMQSSRKQRVSGMVDELLQRQRYSNKIINGYGSGMQEFLSGEENNRVFRDLEEMEDTVNGEIGKKYAQIDEDRRIIAICNSNIAADEARIRAIEEQMERERSKV